MARSTARRGPVTRPPREQAAPTLAEAPEPPSVDPAAAEAIEASVAQDAADAAAALAAQPPADLDPGPAPESDPTTAAPVAGGSADAPPPDGPEAAHPMASLVGPLTVEFHAAGIAGPARAACLHNAPADTCPACGVEVPLDEGEEVIATTVRIEPCMGSDDVPVLYFVTSAGRKVGVDPDGWMAVVTGPDLDTIQPPAPKPPRRSWKEPRD